MRKNGNVFWGILFLLGALAAIVGGLGYLEGMSFWTILFSVAFIGLLLEGIYKRSWGQILFSLAFITILVGRIFHISVLSPFLLLGAALFGTIGLNMLFPTKKRWGKYIHKRDGEHWNNQNYESYQEMIEEDEETVHCEMSFGSSAKYINCKQLRTASLKSSFGDLQVYFDNAVIKDNEAMVYIEVSFGSMDIYIPREWKVVINVSNAFGNIDQSGNCNMTGEKVLVLEGNVSFGNLNIHCI